MTARRRADIEADMEEARRQVDHLVERLSDTARQHAGLRERIHTAEDERQTWKERAELHRQELLRVGQRLGALREAAEEVLRDYDAAPGDPPGRHAIEELRRTAKEACE